MKKVMKAYTTINYVDLSLEEVVQIGKRIHHVAGRNNGLLYNGQIVLSVPMNGVDFTIDDYLEENPDIVNCGDDFNKFIDIIKNGKCVSN